MPPYSRRPNHPTSISRNFSGRFSIFEKSHKGKKPCPCGIPQGTFPCGKRKRACVIFKFPSRCSLGTTWWRELACDEDARGDVRFHARYGHTAFTDGTCRGVPVSASHPGFFSIPYTAAAAPTTPSQRRGLWLCIVQALATVHRQRFV